MSRAEEFISCTFLPLYPTKRTMGGLNVLGLRDCWHAVVNSVDWLVCRRDQQR
jgi:hypothetical protein